MPETSPRVFVVEDDPALRAMFRAVFRRHSIDGEFAEDGATALERLSDDQFDVLLLDLMLPYLSGFEIIDAIRSRSDRLLDRTIVVTAASDRTLRAFSDGLTVRRVIRKPFDVTDLVNEIRAAAGIS